MGGFKFHLKVGVEESIAKIMIETEPCQKSYIVIEKKKKK
jgi:hypothetical protein